MSCRNCWQRESGRGEGGTLSHNGKYFPYLRGTLIEPQKHLLWVFPIHKSLSTLRTPSHHDKRVTKVGQLISKHICVQQIFVLSWEQSFKRRLKKLKQKVNQLLSFISRLFTFMYFKDLRIICIRDLPFAMQNNPPRLLSRLWTYLLCFFLHKNTLFE